MIMGISYNFTCCVIFIFHELRTYKPYAYTKTAQAIFMPIFRKDVLYLNINENLILECLNELNKNAPCKQ